MSKIPNITFHNDVRYNAKFITHSSLKETGGKGLLGEKLMSATKEGAIEEVRLLIESGANVDYTDTYGFTALIYAIIMSHTEIVKILIENEANINFTSGFAPLTYAVQTSGYTEIIKLLIENGATVNHIETNGFTALLYAATASNTEAVKVLIENGAISDIEVYRGLLIQNDPSLEPYLRAQKWYYKYSFYTQTELDIIKTIITNKFINGDYTKEEIDQFFTTDNNYISNNPFTSVPTVTEEILSRVANSEVFIRKKSVKVLKYLLDDDITYTENLDWLPYHKILTHVESSLKTQGIPNYKTLAQRTLSMSNSIDFTNAIQIMIAKEITAAALLEEDLRHAAGEKNRIISYFHPLVESCDLKNLLSADLTEYGQLSEFLKSIINTESFSRMPNSRKILEAAVHEEMGTHFPDTTGIISIIEARNQDMIYAITHLNDYILQVEFLAECSSIILSLDKIV